MKLCAVIPAYNEERTVAEAVRKCLEHVDEVIVVDDGSTDATAEEAERAGAVVYRHEHNVGEGGATRTGIKAALERGADAIVTVDADGQHAPEEMLRLLKPVIEGRADIVFGTRMHNFTGPRSKWLGNLLLTWLTSRRVSDSQCGYRAMSRRAALAIDIESNRYEVASEIVLKAVELGLRIEEVPVRCIYRDARKGTGVRDGIAIALWVLRWRLKRLLRRLRSWCQR